MQQRLFGPSRPVYGRRCDGILNSIAQFLKTALDGLASPQLDPLQAVVMPPVDVDNTVPIAYIWAADGDEVRHSAPRPIALQKITWKVDVGLLLTMEIDDPNAETAFPLLVDQITALLNTTPIPVDITDPVTGFKTTIISLGEKLSIRYARVKTTGSEGQGLVKFGGEFALHVEEFVSYQPGSFYG